MLDAFIGGNGLELVQCRHNSAEQQSALKWVPGNGDTDSDYPVAPCKHGRSRL